MRMRRMKRRMRMESENRRTTMMTMMKNMLMTGSTLAAYAANQVQCDALYQCLAGVVPDRCGCCQVPLNVTTTIIFFSTLIIVTIPIWFLNCWQSWHHHVERFAPKGRVRCATLVLQISETHITLIFKWDPKTSNCWKCWIGWDEALKNLYFKWPVKIQTQTHVAPSVVRK